MKRFITSVLMHLRYGSWFAMKADGQWYAERYWLFIPCEYEGPFTKREAEGVAALNNESRGL